MQFAKPFRSICWVLSFLLIVLLGFSMQSCIFNEDLQITNPISPSYSGDYQFTVNWNNKPLTATDSLAPLYAMTPYVLHYKSTGKDEFMAFRIRALDSSKQSRNLIDTLLQGFTGKSWDYQNDRTVEDSFTVYFTNTYKGKIRIEGIRSQCNQSLYNFWFCWGETRRHCQF